ncbi:hypothetical protein MPSEU_000059000 [Mayamaea pseudoterrestris]|nr:hypothetical protein MPSEU_000059000 [Mayamaea pseudoterrestris]
MGWTNGTSINLAARVKQAGAVMVEDFPTLPAAAKPKAAKLQAGVRVNRIGAGRSMVGTGSNGYNAVAANTTASMGPPQPSYSSANALMKKMNSMPLSLSVDMFPSLGGNPAPPYASSVNQTNLQPLTKKAPPSFSSEQDFAAPPVSSQPHPKAKMHMANAPTASDVATIKDMKAAMGAIKFKLLKKFTREFVTGELESEAFVDHVASRFDNG